MIANIHFKVLFLQNSLCKFYKYPVGKSLRQFKKKKIYIYKYTYYKKGKYLRTIAHAAKLRQKPS